MSPAKIAIAVAATMAPSAGIGAMKNVMGTSSAVAMVAVRPGIAPTKMPKADDAKITHRTNGSKTSLTAATITSMRASQDCVQPAARQRHTQHGGKKPMDGDRRHNRGQHRRNESNAQPNEQRQQEYKRDRYEAHRFGGEKIEKQQSQSHQETCHSPWISRPRREFKPWRASAPRSKSIADEHSATQDQADAENAWKQRWAELLAREVGKSQCQRYHRKREHDEREAR